MPTGGDTPRTYHVVPLSMIILILFSAEWAVRMAVQLLLREQGASLLIVSMSSTMCWIGALLGGVVWGRLADLRHARPLMHIVTAGTAASIGSLALLSSAAGALTLSFIRNLVVSGSNPIILALISRNDVKARRERDLPTAVASRSLGGVVGLIGVGFLLGRLGSHRTFVSLAAWSLIALGLVTLGIKQRINHWEGSATQGGSPPTAATRRPPMYRLLLATVLRQMAISGTGSLIYIYMGTLSISPGWMGVTSALCPGIQVISLLCLGRLANRLGRRAMFLLGFALSAAAPAIYALASSAPEMAVGFVVSGIGFGSMYLGTALYVGDVTPMQRHGQMFGLYEASLALGGALGPVISGSIADVVGLRNMLWVMAGLGALSVISALSQNTTGSKHNT